MKIELGGGTRPYGHGFVNLDIIDSADMQIDLQAVGRCEASLPFADDTIDALYSSHFWEHIDPYGGLLHEIVRVCQIGASVEIRVPHWNQSLAMTGGHKHAMSETQVDHWREFPDVWWDRCKKWLVLQQTIYVPGTDFEEAHILFPHLSDQQLMRFIPNTCHEIQFQFVVHARNQM